MTHERPSRWSLARSDWRCRRRLRKRYYLLWALWQTLVLGRYVEECEECANRYISWHAPDPLYMQLVGSHGHTFCPRCFDRKAREAGIWCMWTPMVVAYRAPIGSDRKWDMTTNWWFSPTRDRLMMGKMDPQYMDRGHDVEQPTWARISKLV